MRRHSNSQTSGCTLSKKFDVFLSYNSADKTAVERIALHLKELGLNPFLDKLHLIPGEPWQEALEEALNTSATVAVFRSICLSSDFWLLNALSKGKN